MSQRCAEECEHAVAQELSDRALVAIHRLADALMCACYDLPPIFRIHRLGEFGRTDDIGKKRSDQLAFTFHLGSSGPDLLLKRGRRGLLEISQTRRGLAASGTAASRDGARPVAPRLKPQLLQNFAVGETGSPQFGQRRGSGWPQFSQNFAVGAFSKAQCGHFMSYPRATSDLNAMIEVQDQSSPCLPSSHRTLHMA